MATLPTQSLKGRFAALQAERERTWPAAQLQANASQRATLVERFDAGTVAQIGDTLPSFSFAEVGGDTLTLDGLTADGSALFIFFRFAGCPACNIALPHYAETLFPSLSALGTPMVALSPQEPHRLRDIKQRHDLPFAVATDADNGFANELGIAFQPDNRPSPPPPGWIGEVTGTGTWELPQPSVLLLGPRRIVQWLQVSPDWLDRAEAEDILTQFDRITPLGARRS